MVPPRENGMVIPQKNKIKTELPYDTAIPLLGIHESESRDSNICTPMFIAPLIITAKRWKQPKCPLADEWINKMWCIHTREYYSAFKRKEILTHATIWINLRSLC